MGGYLHISMHRIFCNDLADALPVMLFISIEKASICPFRAFRYPDSVETPFTVPVLARTLLCASVLRIRLLSVPSIPASGNDSSNGRYILGFL